MNAVRSELRCEKGSMPLSEAVIKISIKRPCANLSLMRIHYSQRIVATVKRLTKQEVCQRRGLSEVR